MIASPLQAIRLSVANLAAARHFWESAMGFQYLGETAVDDPILRKIWGTEGGSMRAARLERSGSNCRLELFHWEGCTGEPIRDPRRPWDLGVAELQIPAQHPDRLFSALERQCEILQPGSVFLTPFGERCRIAPSGQDEAAVLSVASLEDCDGFFSGFLGWRSGQRKLVAGAMAGAASVNKREAATYGSPGAHVEGIHFERTADPRATRETAERMSPAYTGVWMLTASVDRLEDMAGSEVEVPFVGRRRAVVTRAPGGVRFGVFER
jgi:catechol 2,3-dioxygenase-like lactoylglutathione lyase family enzyme